MKCYGLIGKSLAHSFSKSYFEKKFEEEEIEAKYDNIELSDLKNLKQLIQQKNIAGFNITIPYKESVLSFVNHQSKAVSTIQAANCIAIKNGQWYAHNTDYLAFSESLSSYSDLKTAIILGSGGAAKAIAYALETLKIPFQQVSRKSDGEYLSYEDLKSKDISADLVVNCTPLGTFPNTEEMPELSDEFIEKAKLVYDLTYNPAKTMLLRKAMQLNVAIKNGHEMLVLQAEKSWDIWNHELEGI